MKVSISNHPNQSIILGELLMTTPIYTVYKITNQINEKIYIGVHATTNPNDNYMGSGDLIKKSILKYGKENFTKSILFEYDNSKDAYLKESQIVNQSFVKSKNTYNIAIGGKIPPSNLGVQKSQIHCKNISLSRIGINFSKEHIINLSKSHQNIKQSKSTIEKRINNYNGDKHYKHIGYYITPWGKYGSSMLAIKNNKISPSHSVLVNWCKNPDKIISNKSYVQSPYLKSLNENPVGKSPRDIGFGFMYFSQ